jgi:cell wall assembly regulator SMI1
MGYNQEDAYNLNRAKETFGMQGMDTDLPDEMLSHFPITAAEYGQDAADLLTQALMSATRFDESMNLWIDVQQAHIPSFVSEAIVNCRGFGLRLVVTHGEASSHAPGAQLSTSLIDAIAQASATRQVWHPVAKRLVPSIKYLAGSS